MQQKWGNSNKSAKSYHYTPTRVAQCWWDVRPQADPYTARKIQTGTTNRENCYLAKLRILVPFDPTIYSQVHTQNSDQSVIPELTASAPPRNLPEVEILRPSPRSSESEVLRVELSNLCLWPSSLGHFDAGPNLRTTVCHTTHMCIFFTFRNWKQPICLSTEWINCGTFLQCRITEQEKWANHNRQ